MDLLICLKDVQFLLYLMNIWNCLVHPFPEDTIISSKTYGAGIRLIVVSDTEFSKLNLADWNPMRLIIRILSWKTFILNFPMRSDVVPISVFSILIFASSSGFPVVEFNYCPGYYNYLPGWWSICEYDQQNRNNGVSD